ncbi:MAG: helicase [Chloroflexi bacterium AL-N10]|nr:helicase [Chloroflexi bacterium AL-N1]NOK70844.1 helicase [Chloroflexi bacterium AL-N10]NOK78404.1 helicase [Chloroflexi bacterium AL-N5]NOK92661.1 helicase [Chloroflexi bacterium AL-N15]
MQSVTEIIQAIARQRTRGDTTPLSMLRELDDSEGERISHLPVDGDVGQAWVAMTGEPFRPHQAQALTALRRGEPVALSAANSIVTTTAYLLLYASLHSEVGTTALILAPTDEVAQHIQIDLDTLNTNLPQNVRLSVSLVSAKQRPNPYARIMIATPSTLHHRILRHHDRVWRFFWSQLHLVVLPDIHRYTGVAGAHISDLMLRLQRIANAYTYGQFPHFLATLTAIDEPDAALTKLLGTPWRVISGDDAPHGSTTLAVWHTPTDHVREAAEIALDLQKSGYTVHLLCQELEVATIAPLVSDVEKITFGPEMRPSHVLIVVGYTHSHAAFQRTLHASYQAVVLVLGKLPHEQALARHVDMLLQDDDATTDWPAPPANAYVTAQHILCAANELPLTEAEVEHWGVQHIVNRLVDHNQLVDLPDPEVAWKPGNAVDDPFIEFHLLSSSGAAIVARNEYGQTLAQLDPTSFERWTFLGAALPPGSGGLRVTSRDEETGSVVLRLESNGRRTYPLRRCQATIREERDTRVISNIHRINWGRIIIDEEIHGYCEITANGTPTNKSLSPPLKARWITHACWFDLPNKVNVKDQFVGWCLAAALPLYTLASFTDVVTCYDPETQRLYIVDAQPGSSGLATWLYEHAEALLPIAYDIALACRNDPLLEPLSRADMDWLLALLGKSVGDPLQKKSGRAKSKQRQSKPPSQPTVSLSEVTSSTNSNEVYAQKKFVTAPPSVPTSGKPSDNRVAPLPSIPAPGNPSDKRAAPPPSETNADEQRTSSRRRQADPPPTSRANANRTRERERSQPPKQPEQDVVRDDETPPDPEALIARLRQRREAHEATQKPQSARRRTKETKAVEPRFAAGEHIFCLPYGNGKIEESRIEDGREVLSVVFPDHGELTIDPAVSLVRKLDDEEQLDTLL